MPFEHVRALVQAGLILRTAFGLLRADAEIANEGAAVRARFIACLAPAVSVTLLD
jgi:hypothetical protein